MSLYSCDGKKDKYFILIQYKFFENDKIDEGTLLNATNNSLNPFDYHLGNCGVDCLKTLEPSQIHCFYTVFEEDTEDVDDVLIETDCCNGTNEVVRIFDQKCVLCYEKDSEYAI